MKTKTLNKLISELCPDGAEYKSLSEFSTYKRGRGFKKNDKGAGCDPIIFYGELYTIYGNYINNIVSTTDRSIVNNPVIVNNNDIVLPISSTTKEAQIGKASLVKQDNVILGSDAIALYHDINPSYLMYCLNSNFFEVMKMRCVSGTTIRHLSPKEFMQIQIPVPPLEIQREIVRILDNFSELTARKKQYEYYRDALLNFENPIGGGILMP